jgi:CMP/dCMP kinase
VSGLAPVIAVDGPSGVGKGMLTRWLAHRLGWQRLDSGALYRILALEAHDRGIDMSDADSVAAVAPALEIQFVGTTEQDERILVNGHDWTRRVRAEDTGGLASRIATAPAVRAALLKRQREFCRPPGLVADGRDMGTVVFPDALLKIFLDATPEERARRRLAQLSQAGITATLSSLCEEIRARDDRDRNRAVAPLKPAADAILVDTTGLPPQAVHAKVDQLLRDRGL